MRTREPARFHEHDPNTGEWWEIRVYPHADDLATIQAGITDRQQAQREIERQRATLERAEQVADLGHWTFDPDTGDVTWSRGRYTVHQADPGEFEPSLDAFLTRVHPQDRERVGREVEQVIETGERLSFDYRTNPEKGPERIRHSEGRPRSKTARSPHYSVPCKT
jgi:hypothetical protein